MQENVNIPDSTITTNLSFRQLVLMNMQQLTNFPYIEKDFDALTDYELLSLVVKYLNDVIANQNEQNDSITRMYESFLALQTYVNNTKDTLEDAFNELDDYVRNYFANLDVQDEIDNKLDEYVEDGTLEHIIASYLQTQKIYNTHTEMIADESNLVNGLTVQTLGYNSLNDGGGSFYKITNTESLTEYQEEIGDLYATLIIKDYVYPEMFGAYGDGIHDDTLAIQTAITNFNNIKFYSNKTYKITKQGTTTHLAFDEEMFYSLVISKSDIIIDGNNSTLINNDTDETSFFINTTANLKNIEIKNLSIIMDNENYVYIPVSGTTKIKGISLSYCNNIKISNINFKTFKGDCIEILDADNVNINNINVDDVVGHGLSLGKPSHGITRLTVENCYIKDQHVYDQNISTNPMIIGAENGYINNVYMKSCEWGFKVEPPSKNVKVINCTFDTGSNISENTGFKTQGIESNLVEDIIFDNCKVLNNLSTGHAFYDIYSKNVIIKNCEVIKSKGVRLEGQNVLLKDCYFYDSKQALYIRNGSNKVSIKNVLIEIDSSDYFDTALINNQATTNKVIMSGITIKSTVSDLSRYITFNNCDCDNIYIYAPDILGSGKFGGVGANTKINNCNVNASLGKVFKLDCSTGTSTRFTSAAFPYGAGICASFAYIPFNCTVSAVSQLNNNIDFTHTENANAYILIYLLDYYRAV